jgi:hypothetical protein
MPRAVADLVFDARHAGELAGADRVGEATGGERLLVRVGWWTDVGGRVRRARYRATTCAALIAYAEAACGLLEAGRPPGALSADALCAEVAGIHPGHQDRADLVAAAIRAAATPSAEPHRTEGSPA